ncbi:hypothetical protein BN1723_013225, partial [Verticillium longisporum]
LKRSRTPSSSFPRPWLPTPAMTCRMLLRTCVTSASTARLLVWICRLVSRWTLSSRVSSIPSVCFATALRQAPASPRTFCFVTSSSRLGRWAGKVALALAWMAPSSKPDDGYEFHRSGMIDKKALYFRRVD